MIAVLKVPEEGEAEPPSESDKRRRPPVDRSRLSSGIKGAMRSHQGGSNVVSMFAPSEKTRADFDSDLDYELYLAWRNWDQSLKLDAELEEAEPEPTPAAGAEADVRDESAAYHRWLQHATPIGYTTYIRTRPKSKWTEADYVVIDGVRYAAPRRFTRGKLKASDGKWVYFDLRDHVKVDTETVTRMHTLPASKVQVRQRFERLRIKGLSPLGRPYLCSFTPLDFSSPEAYQASKEKYLRRRSYSQDVRKKHNKSVDPASRVLVRRPPDVMWFLKHPDGKSVIYGDEKPWPHGVVDPMAQGVNDDMNRKAAEVANAMKIAEHERREAQEGLDESYLSERERLNAFAERLKEAKPGYRPEDVYDQDELIGDPSAIAPGENQLPSDSIEAVSGVPAVLEGEYIPAQETAKGKQSAHKKDAVSYTEIKYVEGVSMSEPDPEIEQMALRRDMSRFADCAWKEGMGDKEKENLSKLLHKATTTFWSEPTQQPEAGADQDPNVEMITIPSHQVKVRYDDERYIGYVEELLAAVRRAEDDLSYAYMKLRMIHGKKWTDEFSLLDFFGLEDQDVNVEGLLDDMGFQKILPVMPASTIMHVPIASSPRVDHRRIGMRRYGELLNESYTPVRKINRRYRLNFLAYAAAESAARDAAKEVQRRAELRAMFTDDRQRERWAEHQQRVEARLKAVSVEYEVEALRRIRETPKIRASHETIMRMREYARRRGVHYRRHDEKDYQQMVQLSKVGKVGRTKKRLMRKASATLARMQRFFNKEETPTTESLIGEIKSIPPTVSEAPVPQGETHETNTEATERKLGPVIKVAGDKDLEAANDPIMIPEVEEPTEIVAGVYMRMRRNLRLQGIEPGEFERTDEAVYRSFPRVWQRFSDHQGKRSKLVA